MSFQFLNAIGNHPSKLLIKVVGDSLSIFLILAVWKLDGDVSILISEVLGDATILPSLSDIVEQAVSLPSEHEVKVDVDILFALAGLDDAD